MRKSILYITFVLSLNCMAQKADTVNATSADVFYNLKTATETKVDVNSWDIGFTTAGFDASILVNENKGVELYVYSADTLEWNSVDTSGFDFENSVFYNSTETWSIGAFNNSGVVHPDYGWGIYDGSNHNINGNRIFIIKHGADKYTQFQVSSLTASGTFTVKFAELGGGATQYLSFSKSSYNVKNFVYCNVETRSLANLEPISTDWHLLFTKYMQQIQAGPDLVYYPVAGVKINKNLKVAERSNVAIEDNDTNGLNWNSNITEIGYDWKTFNNSTFQYDVTPDLSYFIKNSENEVWKIWFTKYSSSTFYINVEQIGYTASLKEYELFQSSIYPVPATTSLTVRNSENALSNVEVVTIDGKVVIVETVAAMSEKDLDLAALKKGFYLVRINAGNKFQTHRLIIE